MCHKVSGRWIRRGNTIVVDDVGPGARAAPAGSRSKQSHWEYNSEFGNAGESLTTHFAGVGVEGEGGSASPSPQRSPFALVRAIPDDPNYRKYIPLNYRLNAKKIIGEIAQDLSSKGKSSHFWVELIHWGLVGAEMFAEGSLLVSGAAIAGPLLGLVGVGFALGAPYYEAGQEIAAKFSALGFSRGVVMGADGRSAKLLKIYFGDYSAPKNLFFSQGQAIGTANFRMGLMAGYIQGRRLSKNQLVIFWRDLGHRIGDQSHLGSPSQWNREQWITSYVVSAAFFRRDHLE